MATDFRYASQSDLEMYYPDFSKFDAKRQLFGFDYDEDMLNIIDTTVDAYYGHNTGLVQQLFWNGAEMEKIAFNNSTAATTTNENTVGDDTVITMTSGSPFAAGDIVKINNEYMGVESVSTNNVQFTRGALGTTAAGSISSGTNVYIVLDASSQALGADSDSDTPQFVYDTDSDMVIIITDSKDPNNYLVEAGIDSSTYFDQMLVNASMELNNLLDRRYSTPIPKYTQYDANTAHISSAPEYDAIIIKSTCYICVANLLRTNNRQEEADYYNNLITNMDGSGLVDLLNKGEYKLSYEVDSDDSQGKVRAITKTGSMDIIETGGAYYGEPFDLLRITCTTAGAYGVAKVKVEYYGSDKLFGQEKTDITVKGTLQDIHNGWYCRFQGSSMAVSDLWEVEVYSETRKISNAESGAIQLTRRGYGI